MNHRVFRIAAAVAAALSLSACVVVPTGPLMSDGVSAAEAQTARVSTSGFGGLLNQQRNSDGLRRLSESPRLAAAAEAHAQDMVRQNYFSHTGADGSSVGQRVRAEGYSWCWVAENIAAGDQTEASVFNSWLNSPPHRRNMLNREAVQYGLGRTGNTWVLVLAEPC